MNILEYTRVKKNGSIRAKGNVTTIIVSNPRSSGVTKLGITPGGGGSEGIVNGSMMHQRACFRVRRSRSSLFEHSLAFDIDSASDLQRERRYIPKMGLAHMIGEGRVRRKYTEYM